MLQKIISWIKGVAERVLNIGAVKSALRTDVAISTEMRAEIDRWWAMFQGRAEWLDRNTQSLGLPSAIAGEMARLTTVELKGEITGGARAETLNEQLQTIIGNLRAKVEYAVATGGMVLKPYVDGDRIVVDYVHAGRFVPTAYNSRGEITGVVFVEQVKKGRTFYTRLEHHLLTDKGYIIRNLAYMAYSKEQLGTPVHLGAVDEWANLEPELILRYADGTAPERPLFSYFRMPFANQIDDSSPLGVSVYSRAVDLICEADRQYSRILWEYEGSELAIDISVDALKDESLELPERRKRLFRGLAADDGERDLYKPFSPPIRDSSLFNGLNQLLRRIEFACYLSYGTLSDPNNVDKTAEEIRASKQRSYSAVCDVQRALQGALEHLVWAMDFYATLYQIAPVGKYETAFTFGDSIVTDETAQRLQDLQDVRDGLMAKWEYRVKWYGESESQAKEMISSMDSIAEPMFREVG